MSEIDSAEFQQRVLNQAFELWFTPELTARQKGGTLPTPYFLFAAQVVFSDASHPIVRLNEEVKGNARLRAGSPEMTVGQPIFANMLKYIERFELIEAEANLGHFTALRYEDRGWAIVFDFQRNKATAADLVGRATRFISAARHSFELGFEAPYVDNLFSACELLARARLIPSSKVALDSRSHGLVHSSINKERKLGNVNGDFVELFNDLSMSRSVARYARHREVTIRAGDDALSIAKSELQRLQVWFRRELDG